MSSVFFKMGVYFKCNKKSPKFAPAHQTRFTGTPVICIWTAYSNRQVSYPVITSQLKIIHNLTEIKGIISEKRAASPGQKSPNQIRFAWLLKFLSFIYLWERLNHSHINISHQTKMETMISTFSYSDAIVMSPISIKYTTEVLENTHQ